MLIGTLVNGEYIGLLMVPLLAYMFQGAVYRFDQNRAAWWFAAAFLTVVWLIGAIGLFSEARA